jgi:hypothetical protein
MPYGNFYYGKNGFFFKRMGGVGNRRNFAIGAMCNQSSDIYNSYVPGAGVGGTSIATRRAKLIRATKCYGGLKCGRFDTYLGIKPLQKNTILDIISQQQEQEQEIIQPIIVYNVNAIPSPLTSNQTFITPGNYPIQEGDYIVSYSSDYRSGLDIRTGYMAFDNVNSSNWTSNVSATTFPVDYSYDTSTGIYNTNLNHNVTIVDGNSIAGEWLQVQLPYRINLKQYSLSIEPLALPTIYNYKTARFPNTWIIVGSNDYGATWHAINSQSGQSVSSTSNYETKTYSSSTNNEYYDFYRIIVTVVGSVSDAARKCVQINQWDLVGNIIYNP